jgi:hypothetical protein
MGNCKQRNVARVRRRTREEIRQMVAEFASSGMKQDEFCRSRGISRSSLDRYLRRQRVQALESGGSNRFVAVEVMGASGSSASAGGRLVVALASGRRIEVERGFDAVTLERLLMILEKG